MVNRERKTVPATTGTSGSQKKKRTTIASPRCRQGGVEVKGRLAAKGLRSPAGLRGLTLAQLQSRLSVTVQMINTYMEDFLSLQSKLEGEVRNQDHIFAASKVPSLEQVLAENKVDPSELRQFELSSAERAYQGAEDDRKARLEHRQRVQTRCRELEEAKKRFLEAHTKAVVDARDELLAVRARAKDAVREAESHLESAKEKIRVCEEERRLLEEAIEQVRKGGNVGGLVTPGLPGTKGNRGKSCHAGNSGNSDGSSKLTNKKPVQYPIDDELLSDPRAFKYQPSWLDVEDAARKVKLLTISDNLHLIGSKAIGTKVPSSDVLEKMIAAMAQSSVLDASAQLAKLYQCLMGLLVAEDVRGKMGMGRSHWGMLLSDGCWPEIVRRFVMLRHLSEDTPAHQRPDQQATQAVSILRHDAVEALTFDQHLVILHYLSDTILVDSQIFQDAVSSREKVNTMIRKEIYELSRRSRTKERDVKIREMFLKLIECPDTRIPIGFDRYQRRYWWGLGGMTSELLVEDTIDFIAVVDTEEELEELTESLDFRGRRERALKQNFLILKDTIVKCIQRKRMAIEEVVDEAARESAAGPAVAVRQSSRQARQAEFFDPSKSKDVVACDVRKAPKKLTEKSYIQYKDHLSIISHLPPSALIAVADAILILVDLGREAVRLGVFVAGHEWEEYHKSVTTFGFQYGSLEYRSASAQDIARTLREQALVLEGALHAKSRALQGLSDTKIKPVDVADVDKVGNESVNDILTPPAPKRLAKHSIYLWNTRKERASWLADMTDLPVCSCSRLNYALRVLQMAALPLLAKLETLDCTV